MELTTQEIDIAELMICEFEDYFYENNYQYCLLVMKDYEPNDMILDYVVKIWPEVEGLVKVYKSGMFLGRSYETNKKWE